RSILKPLIKITDQARQFVRNRQLSEKSENRYIPDDGEIGTLAAAVYGMTAELAEQERTRAEQAAARDRLVEESESLRKRTRDLFRENERLKRRFEVIRDKQDSLRRSEERYRTMLENIEEYFYEADLSGNLLFFNDALHRML